MYKQTNKWCILLAIGLFCVSGGMILNHFTIIRDEMTGFLVGLGIGIELVALFKAKKHRQGEPRMS